jgi:four helix bundle protein
LEVTVLQTSKKNTFDHERLRAYQQSIDFIAHCENLLKQVPKKYSVHDQLDRACTSIALNIAEGNGRFATNDRCRYLDLARSSALECAACLDVLVAKGCLEQHEIDMGKEMLLGIVSMLMGLITTLRKRG